MIQFLKACDDNLLYFFLILIEIVIISENL